MLTTDERRLCGRDATKLAWFSATDIFSPVSVTSSLIQYVLEWRLRLVTTHALATHTTPQESAMHFLLSTPAILNSALTHRPGRKPIQSYLGNQIDDRLLNTIRTQTDACGVIADNRFREQIEAMLGRAVPTGSRAGPRLSSLRIGSTPLLHITEPHPTCIIETGVFRADRCGTTHAGRGRPKPAVLCLNSPCEVLTQRPSCLLARTCRST